VYSVVETGIVVCATEYDVNLHWRKFHGHITDNLSASMIINHHHHQWCDMDFINTPRMAPGPVAPMIKE
jgi:hypothetical protein